MFKKLSASIFALALVAGVFAPAQAQDTIGLYLDDPVGGLARFGNLTAGVPFDIVVLTNAAEISCASEFVMSELLVLFPGVFKLSTVKVNNTPLDLGNNAVGEYVLAYQGCVAPGVNEIVRVQYGDFGGIITNDVILGLRGLQPGDSVESTFGGLMGYIDPVDGNHVLDPEPWPTIDATTPVDPTKGPNAVPSGDGVLVLNPATTPVDAGSVSSLKARF